VVGQEIDLVNVKNVLIRLGKDAWFKSLNSQLDGLLNV
jgi:hypothetical protein